MCNYKSYWSGFGWVCSRGGGQVNQIQALGPRDEKTEVKHKRRREKSIYDRKKRRQWSGAWDVDVENWKFFRLQGFAQDYFRLQLRNFCTSCSSLDKSCRQPSLIDKKKKPTNPPTKHQVTQQQSSIHSPPTSATHDSPASDAINISPSIPFKFNEKFIMIVFVALESEETARE